MSPEIIAALAASFFAVAVLYASVGHGGASSYLAVMALFSLSPALMKPTALALDIVVASIATVKFYRAGHFSWAIFAPFALGSIPLAYLGGRVLLPGAAYTAVVGVVLLYAAYRLLFHGRPARLRDGARPVPIGAAVAAGAALGFLSGLIGIGGGIFLTPLLLFAGWADIREAAGVSAAFILVNAVAGLLGHVATGAIVPAAVPVWGVAVAVGGWIGAEYGSRRFRPVALRRILGVVLVLAGLKMVAP